MQEFLNQKFLNNTIWNYILFLLCFIGSIVVIKIIRYVLLNRLGKWAKKTETTVDDALVKGIKKYLLPLLYFGGFYLSTRILYLSAVLKKIINVIVLAFVMAFGAIFLSAVIVFIFNKYWEKKNETVNKLAVKWIAAMLKAIIWTGALFIFLENIGVKITALIAGLGIGGIAIAFAAQAILEDIFSFVTIFFDRPFEIDDFIIVGDMMGTVEHIGIKTTRLRSINGEQLIFSNKDLTNSRLRNYKRMKSRRVLFTIGVTYDTPMEKLREIPCVIKNIIGTISNTTFDRAHFTAFADSSLNFEIAYYVLSQDFNLYMDIQQQINFNIKEKFEHMGIEFAFPTQTLHIIS